ncbi:hypothetical protein L9G74_13730 [Shewanella sp. C32]|uniref:Lipoprotein n=1 Tax=Shewanella electrica TaxID=515560 RepID=A0ABT2FNE1_9GAMM|nr:hypothetical protein [Shewanella electrica]MCH1926124.1 hypothetical protein [Shewanella electrica]MCS4557507.1 hypothetical protein [Shewanella electrica]
MKHCSMQRFSSALFMVAMLSACSSRSDRSYAEEMASLCWPDDGDSCAAAVGIGVALDAVTSLTRPASTDGCAKLSGTKQQECMTQAKALSESIDNHRKQQ